MKRLFQYFASTVGITVRVALENRPEQSHPSTQAWFWKLHVRIENGSGEPLKLKEGIWHITDGDGNEKSCCCLGDGVAGERPTIADGSNFDFVIGTALESPNGTVTGEFVFERIDGSEMRADIPPLPVNVATVES